MPVGQLAGLAASLIFASPFGLVFGLLAGLGAATQHYTLRFWLWRAHTFPWKAQRFLDDAVACILLRRAGGGYSFIHRLLLDYLADSTEQPSASVTTPSSASSP